jgi:hypothetical protein
MGGRHPGLCGPRVSVQVALGWGQMEVGGALGHGQGRSRAPIQAMLTRITPPNHCSHPRELCEQALQGRGSGNKMDHTMLILTPGELQTAGS